MFFKLNHLCATKGLDNQCNRFHTQDLLPRRKPHHNICRCGFYVIHQLDIYGDASLPPLMIYSLLV